MSDVKFWQYSSDHGGYIEDAEYGYVSYEDYAALRQQLAEAQTVPDWAAPVFAELEKAMRKFPTWPTDPLHALAVLGEEFGELTKDMLQLTYEPHKTNAGNVRTEALQTAAMALRLFRSLDAYEYKCGEQHSQSALAQEPRHD